MDRKDFTAKEHTWMMNIELMDMCTEKTESEAEKVVEMCSRIQFQTEQLTLNDLDDLPVEAFYVASQRLMELKDFAGARNLAKQALSWIGEQDSMRKAELQAVV